MTYTIYIVYEYSTKISRLFSFLGKIFTQILIKKRNLIFVGEDCSNFCFSHYNLSQQKHQPVIQRIPMYISDEQIDDTKKDGVLNILTISRFHFPFKGYVIGLINSFSKLYGTHKNISLTIIGYGDGYELVVKTINSLPIEISKKITLIDKVPYHQINKYIKQCDVFVGLGTAIYDAANLNKVGISAHWFQMTNFSQGFFHDDHTLMSNNKYKFEDLLSNLVNIPEKEYKVLSLKTKQILREHYDINVIAPEILKSAYFNFFESIVVKTIYRLICFEKFLKIHFEIFKKYRILNFSKLEQYK